MGVEREVVGGERQVGVEERAEPLTLDGADDSAVPVPEEAVVDEQELRAGGRRPLEELARGGDAAGHLADPRRAHDLHAHRPVVGERVEVEELAREGEDLVAGRVFRHSANLSGLGV
jgi:hypothetical protein